MRYVPLVAALGAKVVLQVQPELVRLCSRMQGAARVIARGTKRPGGDYCCPLMSLPLAFGTRVDTIIDTPFNPE